MPKHQPGNLGERVAALETEMEGLVGNGQPGSVQKLTELVEKMGNQLTRVVILVTVIEVVTHLVSGGGSISLKSLIELLTK